MRRMGKITGRCDDMLIVRGVNLFPTQIEEILLNNPHLCGQYQILVTRERHLDEVDVFVELQSDVAAEIDGGQRDEIGHDVSHHIKSRIGVSARVHVVDPDQIERTIVGKARRVIDKRPKS
jgi:phenylacetate-CoA ligase